MFKRIISAIMTFVILISVQVNAFAEDYTSTWDSTGYWDGVLQRAVRSTSDWEWGGLVQGIAGLLSDGICRTSSDGLHHADTPQRVSNYRKGFGNSVSSATAYCVCKYCGEEFETVITEDDLSSAYDSQVSTLPSTGVDSEGYLYWTPNYNYSFLRLYVGYNYTYDYYWGNTSEQSSDSFRLSVSSEHDPCVFSFYPETNSVHGDFYQDYCGNAPIDGYYYKSSLDRTGYYIKDAERSEFSPSYGSYVTSGSFYQAGDYVSGFFSCSIPSFGAADYASFTMYSRPIRIQPSSGLIDPGSDTTYNINSRPTSITGDYGIIGDNGQITKVDTTTIVNETNNTYTNPSTGTTSTITDWTYDYSDRSYDLTLDTGDTVTVTYGDENVTIQEGDTVYNIYYIVDGTGQGTDPDACQHNYTSTIDREATCTVPGQMTYTCSLCGHTYTEAIPAKGHIWTVSQTVTTEYDEEGNLLQQGYTLYQCSVCGEQYKDEDGTGPPGSDSSDDGESIWDKLGNFLGSIFGGLIGLIEVVLGAILDALTSLATMIGEKLAAVVELVLNIFTEIPVLFTGFLGFLTAVFPFLPEDVMLLLTFGIAVIVFIGIIKALRR